jgi:hypothetical protein
MITYLGYLQPKPKVGLEQRGPENISKFFLLLWPKKYFCGFTRFTLCSSTVQPKPKLGVLIRSQVRDCTRREPNIKVLTNLLRNYIRLV